MLRPQSLRMLITLTYSFGVYFFLLFSDLSFLCRCCCAIVCFVGALFVWFCLEKDLFCSSGCNKTSLFNKTELSCLFMCFLLDFVPDFLNSILKCIVHCYQICYSTFRLDNLAHVLDTHQRKLSDK